MTVKSRLIKGLFASGFGQVVTILTQLLGIPLFLHFWGVEKYGEWLILSSIPAYLAMSDFGFANVAANDMTMNVANNERDKAVGIFQCTFVIILIAAIVSGLVTAIGLYLHMSYGLLPVKNITSIEVSAVISILWVQIIVNQLTGQVAAGYRCDGNFAIGTFYGNLIRLAEFIATAISLSMGGGFVALVLSMLAMRVIGTYAMLLDMRRRSPWLTIGLSESSWMEIRRLIRPALAFMSFPMGNAISLQGFTLVIGHLMGGSAVALFSTYRTLSRFPLQMMGMINASVWPELSHAFGVGNIERVRKLHRFSVGASFWSVLVALSCLFFIGAPFIKFWTAGKIPFQGDLLLTLGLVILANSLWYTSSVVAASSNRHEKIALIYMVGSIISLGLAFVLGGTLGLFGITISLLVIDLVMIYFVLQKSMELTNDSPTTFIVSIIEFPANLFNIVRKFFKKL